MPAKKLDPMEKLTLLEQQVEKLKKERDILKHENTQLKVARQDAMEFANALEAQIQQLQEEHATLEATNVNLQSALSSLSKRLKVYKTAVMWS